MFLRCFAQRDGGQWVAVCVDLNLAAQADSYHKARVKLHQQIAWYVHDALVGPDREFAEQLLGRKAPPSLLARYYFAYAVTKIRGIKLGVRIFLDTLPMVPLKPVCA